MDKNIIVMDCEHNKVTLAYGGTATNQGRERLSTNNEAGKHGPTGTPKVGGRSRRIKVWCKRITQKIYNKCYKM